jgi:hypothetical protein
MDNGELILMKSIQKYIYLLLLGFVAVSLGFWPPMIRIRNFSFTDQHSMLNPFLYSLG